jgi:hypothetical protein
MLPTLGSKVTLRRHPVTLPSAASGVKDMAHKVSYRGEG